MALGFYTRSNLNLVVQNAYSNDSEIQFVAVRNVRKMLQSSDVGKPTDTLIEFGILPILIQCLQKRDNTAIQYEALWALTNIAAGNAEQTLAVANTGVIPQLLELLQSPSEKVSEQALWTLGNVIAGGSDVRDYVITLGIIPSLMSLVISPQMSLKFTQNIAWVMHNLCRCDVPPSADHAQQTLPILCILVRHYDKEILITILCALCDLVSAGNERVQCLIDADVLPILVTLLRHKNANIQNAALRILGNIACGTDEQMQTLLDADVLSPCNDLLTHSLKKIRKRGLWFLSNITAGNEKQIQNVIEAGLLPMIIHALDEKDHELEEQREAAWAVRNLTLRGTKSQVFYMLQQKVLGPFCAQLTLQPPYSEGICAVLDGIKNMLRIAEADVFHITSQIEGCGGLDHIKAQLNNSDWKARHLASEIIRQYFTHDSQRVFHLQEDLLKLQLNDNVANVLYNMKETGDVFDLKQQQKYDNHVNGKRAANRRSKCLEKSINDRDSQQHSSSIPDSERVSEHGDDNHPGNAGGSNEKCSNTISNIMQRLKL